MIDGIEMMARAWNREHAPGTRTSGEIMANGPQCKGNRTEPHRCIVTRYAGQCDSFGSWRLAIGIARIHDERKAAGTYPTLADFFGKEGD